MLFTERITRPSNWLFSFVLSAIICTNLSYAKPHKVNPAEGDNIADTLTHVVSGDEILLMPGIYVGQNNRDLTIPAGITDLTIRSDSHPEQCIIDAQTHGGIFRVNGADIVFEGIRFLNGNSENGSAIFCSGGRIEVRHCEFIENIGGLNGGAVCLLNSVGSQFENCLFQGNTGNSGGAVYLDFTSGTQFNHCSFSQNSATDSAVISAAHSDGLNIAFSILWNDGVDEIWSETGDINVVYSNVDQVFPGPNIQFNPLFVSGSFGDCYLAHADAGYPENSPCVDTFEEIPAEDYPEINSRTTSSFNTEDSDALDLGYHYYRDASYVTPTPTATWTPTPLPSETPLPTETPTPTPEYELGLRLSDTMFTPGILFNLRVDINNWLERENPVRLFVALEVSGQYFLMPTWSQDYQFEYISIPVGLSGVNVLSFVWPDVQGKATGYYFHSIIMNTDGTEIMMDPDFPELSMSSVEFGYTDEI